MPIVLRNFGPTVVISEGSIFEGIASFYGQEFAGRITASGEIFNPNLLTAAHRTLPLDTSVRVINLENARSVIVKITDRGPYVRNRIIDLSSRAAEKLGITKRGLARVQVEVLERTK